MLCENVQGSVFHRRYLKHQPPPFFHQLKAVAVAFVKEHWNSRAENGTREIPILNWIEGLTADFDQFNCQFLTSFLYSNTTLFPKMSSLYDFWTGCAGEATLEIDPPSLVFGALWCSSYYCPFAFWCIWYFGLLHLGYLCFLRSNFSLPVLTDLAMTAIILLVRRGNPFHIPPWDDLALVGILV